MFFQLFISFWLSFSASPLGFCNSNRTVNFYGIHWNEVKHFGMTLIVFFALSRIFILSWRRMLSESLSLLCSFLLLACFMLFSPSSEPSDSAAYLGWRSSLSSSSRLETLSSTEMSRFAGELKTSASGRATLMLKLFIFTLKYQVASINSARTGTKIYIIFTEALTMAAVFSRTHYVPVNNKNYWNYSKNKC